MNIDEVDPIDPINPNAVDVTRGEFSALSSRVGSLETGYARLEQKTDVQTVMLGEIKGALFAGAKTVAENPWVRRLLKALVIALTGAGIAWLGRHGIEVRFSP